MILIWTTRDGRRLKVSEMTKEHLENAIRFLSRNLPLLREIVAWRFSIGERGYDFHRSNRNLERTNEWIQAFREELESRGEVSP